MESISIRFLSLVILAPVLIASIISEEVTALPAFALKENISCVTCHSNGSAPHLTKTGYLYRRAAFRFPTNIGNEDYDLKGMKLTNHLAAGINVGYEYVTAQPSGQSQAVTNNDFNVREVEIWPLVGAFLGNYGVWSEADFSPQTSVDRTTPTPPMVTTAAGGGVDLAQADLRYVSGNSEFFINFRIGLIAPEGYGASDQWLDDGNLPLFDLLTAQFNQDTLVIPFGALEIPEMGAEIGLNWPNTFLTLGAYDGFDGTNGFANHLQSTLAPALTRPEDHGAKDYKVQLDQFLGDDWAFTAAFYDGHVSLLDPTNTLVWLNNYFMERLYVTFQAVPGTIDIFLGGANGTFDYVSPGTTNTIGSFANDGAFIGANWYVMPHLTVGAHVDYFQYARGVDPSPKAQGESLMVNFPYNNNIFVFHYNRLDSEISGATNDLRAEWRFLF